jgi:hypothetical protein
METISPRSVEQLSRQLGLTYPAIKVPFDSIKPSIPKNFSFYPEVCFKRDNDYLLIHAARIEEIPDYVKRTSLQLRHKHHIKVIVLALDAEPYIGHKIASIVANETHDLRFGLATQSGDGVHLIFPPRFDIPRKVPSRKESGHIPKWVYQRVLNCTNLSKYLFNSLNKFVTDYELAIDNRDLDYNKECQLLNNLATKIADGDRRLFYPLEHLHALQSYECTALKRDHFFHSFNNFFLGLIILNRLCKDRRTDSFPENILYQNNRQYVNMKPWESLWFLTSLFHDPGYVSVDLRPLLAIECGLEKDHNINNYISDDDREYIKNTWDPQFFKARKLMAEFYIKAFQQEKREQFKKDIIKRFDYAAQRVFFDGKKLGHGLISGLKLIHSCISDNTYHNRYYNRSIALKACTIAALCISLHEQRFRTALVKDGLSPINFDKLPYANVLMFVDALQDDRRNISESIFPKVGSLEFLRINKANGIITARIRLNHLELNEWPAKIAEYENVMRWTNSGSKIKFVIDYRTAVGI